jgi:hypothetical protein
VEDDACAAHLTDLGIDLLQGYALSRPLPEVALIEFQKSRPVSAAGAHFESRAQSRHRRDGMHRGANDAAMEGGRRTLAVEAPVPSGGKINGR